MTSYYSSSAPWHSYRSSIKSVTIGSGVTSIGSNAFSGRSELNSITIPDSVTSIGDYAFCCCSHLRGTFTIPDSVTYIGEMAFCGCSRLTSFIVSGNSGYKSIDGIIYVDKGKTLLLCPGGKTGSITIPDSVTAICLWAFYGCSGLTSVTIPGSVTSICEMAFYSCSGLTSVTYTGVTEPSFGEKVFDNCPQLTEVSVPYNYKGSSFCGLSINRMPEPKGKGISNTALIASIVSVAAAVVIAAVTALTCYFKNSSSFPFLRKSGQKVSADVEPKV